MVSKIQAAAAKIDTSQSSGMFQTGLQVSVARQKIYKVRMAFAAVELYKLFGVGCVITENGHSTVRVT